VKKGDEVIGIGSVSKLSVSKEVQSLIENEAGVKKSTAKNK
jgi:hypothetical protein